MKFSVDKHEKYVVFKLNEDKLNSIITPMLKSELILLNAEGIRNIILDLSEIKYSDSSGLSAILLAHRLCKGGEQEGTFVLTGISPSVEKLIKISQLENVLNLVPTVDEAIDYIFMEEIERDLKGGAEE
ncbi:STAS domain-containing protein [Solitalea canadensis]|uniref:Anti-anti-sigma regulatory factor (Antagonist of anti-sigma factor) n=1 Tax=Solitalea canadensis (strain ATCC 29591 / DSM 3403 / JCM 21819 / LMG 8368 / NBRC 15130 / NCIMB 12057 / USAM 9D) TaxID=929556 RepID=H8KQQ9_SOLCM|nr:STAS domain-containing protein [Solitalea canadensis]AFD06930.1 anti-anti-sigma regulatory factor (antagonist of anti-sigma factor) [Solitalea canadensis DSM 3403]